MYKHHEEAIENLINYFNKDKDVIAIILGGSVAKECERIDSDIDAMIIVTDEKQRELAEQNRLAECISGYCNYKGGYFDLKYYTKSFLKAIAESGSEPSKNAFVKAKCLYSKDEEIYSILKAIEIFPIDQKEEKMLSFYSTFNLNYGYYWEASSNDIYLRVKTASNIVLFGFRLLLEENNKFFPCNKSLIKTVEELKNKPENIIQKAELLLKNFDDTSKIDFVETILNFIEYKPPKDFSKILTRYVDDNELWWYKNRPNISEW